MYVPISCTSDFLSNYDTDSVEEKISERDRFEFPVKSIFANNSKIIKGNLQCLFLFRKGKRRIKWKVVMGNCYKILPNSKFYQVD